RFLSRVLEQSSDLVRVRAISTVRPLETPVVISPPGALSGIAASSGGDGSEIGEAQFTGQSQDAKKGLFALEKADLFNLLCIPPFSLVTDDPALQRQHLVSQAAAYCETRRAMLLVDPPSAWTTKAIAVNQFSDPNTDFIGTRSKNAALFFPRVRETNPLH